MVMVNQMNIGADSKVTLGEILKDGVTHTYGLLPAHIYHLEPNCLTNHDTFSLVALND